MSGLVWSAQFLAIYGVQSIACADAPLSASNNGLDVVQIAIIAVTILGLLMIAGAPLVLDQPGATSASGELDKVLSASMGLLIVLSAFAVLAAGATALAVMPDIALTLRMGTRSPIGTFTHTVGTRLAVVGHSENEYAPRTGRAGRGRIDFLF